MLSLFKRISDFVIYSNLFIALAAVSLTVAAQIQLNMIPGLHPYLFLVFFATLFEYNLHKFVAVFFYKHSLQEEKFKWISRNLKLFYFIFFSSVTGFAVTAFFAKWEVLVTLFPLGLLTFLYSFPIYKTGAKIFRLREIPLMKIFIISLVWSLTSFLLPFIHAHPDVSISYLAVLTAERCLFIFAITIPFDIRDMESDRKTGLRTIPLILGEKKAWRIASLTLILYIVFVAIHYSFVDKPFLIYPFAISGAMTLYFLNSKRIRSLSNYHYGILDGAMIFQSILVILFFLWN